MFTLDQMFKGWKERLELTTCGGRRRGGEEDVLQQQFLLIREAPAQNRAFNMSRSGREIEKLKRQNKKGGPSMVSCTRISSSLSGHSLEFLSLTQYARTSRGEEEEL